MGNKHTWYSLWLGESSVDQLGKGISLPNVPVQPLCGLSQPSVLSDWALNISFPLLFTSMESVAEDLDVLFLFGDHDMVWLTKHRIKEDPYFIQTAPVREPDGR